MKKLLAILCTVALLLCSLFTGITASAENIVTTYKPSEFVDNGGSGVNINGQMIEGVYYVHPVLAGNLKFVDVAFEAMLTLTDAAGGFIRFASPSTAGLEIHINETGAFFNDYWASLSMTGGSCTFSESMLNKEVRFKVTMAESAAGITYAVYFDGEKAMETLIPQDGVASAKSFYFLTGKNLSLTDAPEEEEKEHIYLQPSNFSSDDRAFPLGSGYDWGNGPVAFVDATFTAMVTPLQDVSYIHFVHGWEGLNFIIHNSGGIMSIGDTRAAASQIIPLGADYLNKPFKLDIVSTLGNDGITYTVSIDDEVKGSVLITNDNALYENCKNAASFIAAGLYMANVDTFNSMYTANELQAVSDFDKANKLTPSDFGLESSKAYNAYTFGYYAGDTANTIFEADVMFENGGNITYPRNIDWEGIKLSAVGTNAALEITEPYLVIEDAQLDTGWGGPTASEGEDAQVYQLKKLTSADLGGENIIGNKFNLKVVLEVFNDGKYIVDEEGNEVEEIFADVRLTYYINDKEVYKQESIADFEEYDDLGNPIFETQYGGTAIFSEADGSILSTLAAENVIMSDPEVKVPVLNQSATATGLAADTVYNTDVVLSAGANVSLGAFGTLSLNEGKLVYTDASGVAKVVSDKDYTDKQFNLKVSARKVDYTGNGKCDDIELGIFVDNKIVNGEFIYVLGGAYKLIGGVAVVASEGAQLIAADNRPVGLNQYTPSDAGWPSTGSYDPVDYGYINVDKIFSKSINPNGVAVNSLFSQKITLDKNNGQLLFYYGPAGGKETCLHIINDFALIKVGGYQFNVQNIPLPAAGTEFLYQVSVEKADMDFNKDGIYNDLRFGFFIDGKLLCDQFFYVDAANAGLLNGYDTEDPYVYVVHAVGPEPGNATFTVTSPDHTVDELADYTEITNKDFAELTTGKPFDNGVYTAGSVAAILNSKLNATLNNKVLKTKVNFVPDENGAHNQYLVYGGYGHEGLTLDIIMNADGVARLKNWIGGAWAYQDVILPDLTANVEHDLWISSKYIDGDIMFGIWVDGKLQNNRYYWSDNATKKENLDMFGIYSNVGASKLVLGEAVDEFVGSESSETYTITPSATQQYTLNGAPINEVTTLTDVGVYDVALVDQVSGLNLVNSKKVVIYKANDLNKDNNVDVLDFIAAHKNIAEELDLDPVASFAAGVKVGDRCTTSTLIALKRVLLFK